MKRCSRVPGTTNRTIYSDTLKLLAANRSCANVLPKLLLPSAFSFCPAVLTTDFCHLYGFTFS